MGMWRYRYVEESVWVWVYGEWGVGEWVWVRRSEYGIEGGVLGVTMEEWEWMWKSEYGFGGSQGVNMAIKGCEGVLK